MYVCDVSMFFHFEVLSSQFETMVFTGQTQQVIKVLTRIEIALIQVSGVSSARMDSSQVKIISTCTWIEWFPLTYVFLSQVKILLPGTNY